MGPRSLGPLAAAGRLAEPPPALSVQPGRRGDPSSGSAFTFSRATFRSHIVSILWVETDVVTSGSCLRSQASSALPPSSPATPAWPAPRSEPSVAACCHSGSRRLTPGMGASIAPPMALLPTGDRSPRPRHGGHGRGTASAQGGPVPPAGGVRHGPGPSVSWLCPEKGPRAFWKDLTYRSTQVVCTIGASHPAGPVLEG